MARRNSDRRTSPVKALVLDVAEDLASDMLATFERARARKASVPDALRIAWNQGKIGKIFPIASNVQVVRSRRPKAKKIRAVETGAARLRRLKAFLDDPKR